MTTRIVVTHQFEALHHYQDAPDAVAFLRSPHRHMFHVRAEIEVFHSDREIEFILCKREVANYCNGLGFDLGTMSCEQIAGGICDFIKRRYNPSWVGDTPLSHGTRRVCVEVSEDGENGAIVE